MAEYRYDPKSLFRDEKRWFPVMGEIHYSRYPDDCWKKELLKMKEGGVDIVSSYVIWIHHEEIENEYDWTGWRNLRKFVETIKECGMTMVLRIGPWVHAEVRNGGFPDWLLKKVPKARATNDERYMSEVRKWYSAVYEQVKGLLLKDGGPIIGVQIENEFGHCGGLWGEEGETHMKMLESMAREIGYDVPLYTATGWGGAITAGMLPVMGGYCDAPWDPKITELDPSGNYVFTHERNDHAIGCDFGIGEGITFDMKKYPYLTAELGGGLQVTLKRRPIAKPKDIGAMTLAKMGSGCNLFGYYMYHGGQNPEGKLTTLEENIATGSLNDMSIKNYDFRAPLGEYGIPNGSYDEVRLLSLFVHDFGEQLASTDVDLPESNPVKPGNLTDLRTSWRYSENSGFVFVNNYQRRYHMADHKNVVLSNEKIPGVQFGAVDVHDEDFFFLPFNMKVGSNLLKTSLASPLCRLGENSVVFYSSANPAGSRATEVSSASKASQCDKTLYQFDGTVTDDATVVTLSRKDALNAHKLCRGSKEYLIVTDAVMYDNMEENQVTFVSDRKVQFASYPELEKVPSGFEFKCERNGLFVYEETESSAMSYQISAPDVRFEKISSTEKTSTYEIKTGKFSCDSEEVLIDISYTGNNARLYENGKLIDDGIYVGEDYPWQIGLKRYGCNEHTFRIEIDALEKSCPIYLEKWPDFGANDILMELKKISVKLLQKKVAEIA